MSERQSESGNMTDETLGDQTQAPAGEGESPDSAGNLDVHSREPVFKLRVKTLSPAANVVMRQRCIR